MDCLKETKNLTMTGKDLKKKSKMLEDFFRIDILGFRNKFISLNYIANLNLKGCTMKGFQMTASPTLKSQVQTYLFLIKSAWKNQFNDRNGEFLNLD